MEGGGLFVAHRREDCSLSSFKLNTVEPYIELLLTIVYPIDTYIIFLFKYAQECFNLKSGMQHYMSVIVTDRHK